MTRINAIRTNAVRTPKVARSMSWGKNTSAIIFAALLIVCSVAVGCSSSSEKDQPKPVTANNQIPVPQLQSQPMPVTAPPVQAAAKPAPKKVVSEETRNRELRRQDLRRDLRISAPIRHRNRRRRHRSSGLQPHRDEFRPAGRSRPGRRRTARIELRQHRLLVRILQRERQQDRSPPSNAPSSPCRSLKSWRPLGPPSPRPPRRQR
jgi:hypothetical protein